MSDKLNVLAQADSAGSITARSTYLGILKDQVVALEIGILQHRKYLFISTTTHFYHQSVHILVTTIQWMNNSDQRVYAVHA